MNTKNNFHTLSFLRIHFAFIVSPFNDELIEIRFGFTPLPHDLEWNQIEVKRIRPSFAFLLYFFVLTLSVNKIEGSEIKLKWIQFNSIPELENCEKVVVRKLWTRYCHLKVLLLESWESTRGKVFELRNWRLNWALCAIFFISFVGK